VPPDSEQVHAGFAFLAVMAIFLAPLLLASALAPAVAKGPAQLCPHLVRLYASKAELPPGARALLPPMAERGGRFNVTDDIGPGEERLPFARFVSARQAGCTLSVRYEYGGIAHGFATALLEQRGRAWVLVRRR
jgi:hypothetical protein